MLEKSLSYKWLLRIAGMLLLLYGLYWIVIAFTAQANVSGSEQYNGPLFFWNPGEVLTAVFFGGGTFFTSGPLLYVGIGLFLLALTTRRTIIAYISLQVALWFGSMSFWFSAALLMNTSGIDVPESFTPFFWGTLVLSLILLARYKPVTSLIRKLYVTRLEASPQLPR